MFILFVTTRSIKFILKNLLFQRIHSTSDFELQGTFKSSTGQTSDFIGKIEFNGPINRV